MDVRKPGWYGQLAISGVATPMNHEGSLVSIIAECVKDLHQTNPRVLADGQKEIVIRFRSQPYPSTKLESDIERSLEIVADLDLSNESGGPRPDENLIRYRGRLCQEGTPYDTADMIARLWFPDSS